jgi:hypothetical protein
MSVDRLVNWITLDAPPTRRILMAQGVDEPMILQQYSWMRMMMIRFGSSMALCQASWYVI